MAIDGAQIVAKAETFRGVPYVWGGTTPRGLDCSGLVKLTLEELGVSGVPRTSEDQWNWVDKIPASEARPGDLVFFGGQGYDGTPSAPGHVGILLTDGTVAHGSQPEMVNAPYAGTDVQNDPFALSAATGFGRVPGTAQATGGGGGGGGILSWPADITGFFSDADHALGTASAVALAFFQPSTYIRLAAGGLALILLVAGLIFLVKAAASG